MKYESLAREVVGKLEELKVTPLFPNLNHRQDSQNTTDSLKEKKRLALEHYRAIDEADVVYLLTPGGYMGTSCQLELGYAIASQKPIYFSEPTNDPALDCYAISFVDPYSVEKFLEI